MVRVTVDKSVKTKGGVRIYLHADLELLPFTLFLGPNLAGRSLLMRATAEALGLPPRTDFARYKDGYIIYLGGINVKRNIRALEQMRELAGKELLDEVGNIIAQELAQAREALKRLKQEGLFVNIAPEDLLPVDVDFEFGKMRWRTPFGLNGSLRNAPSSITAAITLAAVRYAYAMAREGQVYLFIENAEGYAAPPFAFFLGYLISKVAKRASEGGGKLFVLASTNSIDFLRGATSDVLTAYLVKRRVDSPKKLKVEAERLGQLVAVSPFFDVVCNRV